MLLQRAGLGRADPGVSRLGEGLGRGSRRVVIDRHAQGLGRGGINLLNRINYREIEGLVEAGAGIEIKAFLKADTQIGIAAQARLLGTLKPIGRARALKDDPCQGFVFDGGTADLNLASSCGGKLD